MNKKQKSLISAVLSLLFVAICVVGAVSVFRPSAQETEQKSEEDYIKWVSFGVPYSALKAALDIDIDTHTAERHIEWIDVLAYLACAVGEDWSRYSRSLVEKLFEELGDSLTVDMLMRGNKYYGFYKRAYTAVLGGMVGEYTKNAPDGSGGFKTVEGYGLKAYFPLAEGYGFSHYDDFGDGRSFGYRRRHLGNDIMGTVGTPITAVEGGTVEAIGWNRFGGWRLGIRSFDGKRSYYYAHLRSKNPYAAGLKLGSRVKAGDVIGYLGMTGYSSTEGTNGMTVPHLHLGLQLIFDESQKEGENQIWIDMYALVELLSRNRATVRKDGEGGEYYRVYDISDPFYPEDMQSLTAVRLP